MPLPGLDRRLDGERTLNSTGTKSLLNYMFNIPYDILFGCIIHIGINDIYTT